MDRLTVSTCHTLKLIPTSRILTFANLYPKVKMKLLGEAIDSKSIPGTVMVSESKNDGKIKKKITYERSDVTENATAILERLKVSRLVATYIDERGRERVAGSPRWPLSLDYTIEGGVLIVTLQGEGLNPDAFLSD